MFVLFVTESITQGYLQTLPTSLCFFRVFECLSVADLSRLLGQLDEEPDDRVDQSTVLVR